MEQENSTSIKGLPVNFPDFVKSLKEFNSIQSLLKLQKISILMKDQALIRININFEFLSSQQIKHHILLSRHCISFLSKQIILNFNHSGKELYDLDLINLINQYELLKCDLHGIKYQSPDAWLWVLRATNLQHFYMRPPLIVIARYYYIFSSMKIYDLEFTNLLNENLEIDILDIIKIGFCIYTALNINGIFLKDEYSVTSPFLKIMSKENVGKFINLFSADPSMFSEAMKTLKVQDSLLKKYEFNPLKRFPIIKALSEDEKYIIPSTGDFIYSFSEGLYYVLLDRLDEINKKNLFHQIGSIFETYIGTLIRNYNVDLLSRSRLFSEIEYKEGKNTWKTSDWILISEKYIVQIECKKNKPNQYSKMGINFKDVGINKLLSDIAKELDKLVKKETHIRKNLIKETEYIGQDIINIIVYLDEMYAINEYGRKEIIKNMKEENQNFYVFGCHEFEVLCQICRNKNMGISESLLNFEENDIYEIDFLTNVFKEFSESLRS